MSQIANINSRRNLGNLKVNTLLPLNRVSKKIVFFPLLVNEIFHCSICLLEEYVSLAPVF